jgi:hypothetical protein
LQLGEGAVERLVLELFVELLGIELGNWELGSPELGIGILTAASREPWPSMG